MRPTRILLAVLAAVACGAPAATARIRVIPPEARVGLARTDAGDGLHVRFRDISFDSCSIAFCALATDTVTAQVTTFPDIW